MELLKLLTPLGATSLTAESSRVDSGTVNCIEYLERNEPVDRLWPTVEAEQGFAELIFGTALGILRSEVPGVDVTTAVM